MLHINEEQFAVSKKFSRKNVPVEFTLEGSDTVYRYLPAQNAIEAKGPWEIPPEDEATVFQEVSDWYRRHI